MRLDLPTLLIALFLTSAVLAAAVLAVAWRGRVHQGLSVWGWGLVCNAASYPAFALRTLDWPSLSIVVTNLLTASTLALHTLALMVFQRGRARPLPVRLVWGAVLLNLLVAALLQHDDHWRNILVAATQSALAAGLLHQAWGPGLEGRRLTGRWVVVAGAGLLLVSLLVRTGVMVAHADWDGRYRVPDQVQAWTYFTVLAVLLLNSMGFVLMQMEQALSQQHNLATHDGLTGVHNRLALMEALERDAAQARRSAAPLALLMLDIDHFKAVNDRHGHLAGDAVLREVAQRASQRLRHADLLARYGGEEFVALLPHTDAQGAVAVAEDIRQAIAQRPCVVQGVSIPVAVSIGVCAAVPSPGSEGVEALLAASDRALYTAKDQGRNRVVLG
jgi:diguanylate cyclase (GGDEF)-like protein